VGGANVAAAYRASHAAPAPHTATHYTQAVRRAIREHLCVARCACCAAGVCQAHASSVPGACTRCVPVCVAGVCAWRVCVRAQVRAGLHSPLAESDSSVAESRSMLSSSSSVLAGVSSASSSPIVQLRQSAVMVSEGWMRWHWCAGGENLPGRSLLHALKLECMRVASKTAPLRHRNAHARCSPLTGDDATLSARGS